MFKRSYKEDNKAAIIKVGYIGTNKLLRIQPLSSGESGREWQPRVAVQGTDRALDILERQEGIIRYYKYNHAIINISCKPLLSIFHIK